MIEFSKNNVNKKEQKLIMDVMDKYRNLIFNGEKVFHGSFEGDIVEIFGGYESAMLHHPAIEYHFCEFVAEAYMKDRRWEEVFEALYGDMSKYRGMKN